jgi:hypothetical protein
MQTRSRTTLPVRIDDTKRCSDCAEYKKLDEFFNATKSIDGKANYCKECKRERAWVWSIKAKFNMTPDDYHALLEAQNGECAICPATDPGHGIGGGYGRWYIDHNHTTGEVRGLLCRACNMGLGKFGDDPIRLRAAADYLER